MIVERLSSPRRSRAQVLSRALDALIVVWALAIAYALLVPR